jgi:hypothetical protein
MKELIAKTLKHCGYDSEPTETNLRECFYDYVDSGKFGNMDLDEAIYLVETGEVTVKEMCYNLLDN